MFDIMFDRVLEHDPTGVAGGWNIPFFKIMHEFQHSKPETSELKA